MVNPTREIMDFLLSAPTPEQVIRLQASEEAQERIRYLFDGNRNSTLSDAESAELQSYLQLEHFVRQLKIRTREKLAELA
jgi:phosphopantetheinyl transferase